MSTATTAPVNAKFNTIQPIEGAKGNIALFYYQGKYPMYKSLDDNMYHLKSVIEAVDASTDTDIKKIDIREWKKLDSTRRLINYLSEHGYPGSEPVIKKQQQNAKLQYLDGWYICEKLMLDLAGWLDTGFHCEIYDMYAMSAERGRLSADINHKPISLIISPAISTHLSMPVDHGPEDRVIDIINRIIRKADNDELGIINFNHIHRILSGALMKTTKDINITRGLCMYFGGHMYRLKEQPTYVMSDVEPDYNYSSRKCGKNIVYTLKPGKQSLTDYARKNNYSTEDFKRSFLRNHAMTTIDSTGCGKCKDEGNSDVYIIGWKLKDVSEIFN